MSFTVVTNNIPGRAPRAKVKAHIQGPFLRPSPKAPPTSVAALQEIREWHDELRMWLPKRFRTAYEFIGQGWVWDSSQWDLIDIDSFISTGPTDVGEKGAGPPMMGQKRVQWLHLRRRVGAKGANLYLFNTHAVPSIHVPKQKDGDRSRDSLHEENMRELAAKVRATRAPVISVGDFNAEWDHPNMRPLRQAGLRLANDTSGPGRATHGRRQIDLITYRSGLGNRLNLRVDSTGLLPKVLKGDHSGVYAEFSYFR